MATNNILIGAGLIGFGAILILIGIGKNKKCSGRAVGKITGIRRYIERDKEGRSQDLYSPEFEYEVNGQIYHGVGSTNYRERNSIRIGDTIEVYYNPNKPQEHFTKGGGKLLPMAGALGVVAGIVSIFTALNG